MRWLLLLAGGLAAACGVVSGISHGNVSETIAGATSTGVNAATLVNDLNKCDQMGALAITFDEERTIGGTVALNWVQLGGGLLVDVPAIPDASLKTPAQVPIAPTPRNQLTVYLNVVGKNVAQRSSRPTLQWTFGVVDSPTVNAFSAPGGYVFVTRGLLLKVNNEAELAGVLAHEVAHVTHKDAFVIYRQTKIDRCKSVAYTKAGSKEAGTALRSYGPGFIQQAIRALDAFNGVLDLDSVANQALLTLFSDELVHRYFESGLGRDQELAADAAGLELTVAAGYSPRGFVGFVGALPNDGKAFAHHPPPRDRVVAMNLLLGGNGLEPLSALAVDTSKLPLVPLGNQLAAAR
ncbi:MAG TPA: M48 family metallopeptidase [Myxococcaceae bacterium]|nr:M48 family metallopeptidase [Myxococcaceae bacterium]